MKIKSMTMAILIFVIIFGGIGATVAVDLWSTTSDKTPVKITEGEAEGKYNPADIRGSYTFTEVSELFEVELEVLYQAFGISLETDGTKMQIKELETLYADSSVEVGTESVQIFVALYKNLPIDLDESYLPKQAVELILQVNTNLTQEQKDYLASHSLDVSGVKTSEVIAVEEEITNTKDSESEESENVVNGSATFQKVLEAGVTKEEIEEILGTTMPPSNQTVKDYCVEAGLSFSDVKTQLNERIE